MSEVQTNIDVTLSLIDDYKFTVDFGDMGQIITDEPAPLGSGEGPNPGKLLVASIANCLAASLLFAVRKFKEDPGQVTARVRGVMERQNGRWRIEKVNVTLSLSNGAESMPHLERALAQFEDFCIVTQSVRQGIEVNVDVIDTKGNPLKSNESVY